MGGQGPRALMRMLRSLRTAFGGTPGFSGSVKQALSFGGELLRLRWFTFVVAPHLAWPLHTCAPAWALLMDPSVWPGRGGRG